jgi:hypothetical protein
MFGKGGDDLLAGELTPGASDAPDVNKTQIFGAKAKEGPQHVTQIFGIKDGVPYAVAPKHEPASPPQREPAPPPPQEAAPSPRQTQVFGSNPAGGAAWAQKMKGAPASQTHIFGGESGPPPPTPEAKAPSPGQTQMFGERPAVARPAAAPPKVPDAGQTEIFGEAPGESLSKGPGGKLPAVGQTQIFGDKMAPMLKDKGKSPPGQTQLFGDAPLPSGPAVPPRGQGVPSVQASPSAFASSDHSAWFDEGTLSSAPRLNEKLSDGAARRSTTPRQSPKASAALNGSSHSLPAGQEPTFLLRPPRELDEADAFRREMRARRWRMALLAVAALVAVGGFLAYRTLSGRGRSAQGALLAEMEGAMVLLRRDDTASRDKAIEELTSLTKREPGLREAHAHLSVALSMALDDSRIALRQMDQQAEIIRRKMARLQQEKSPSDWKQRTSALIDELTGLEKERAPVGQAVLALDSRLGQTLREIGQPEEELSPRERKATLRAQAMYYAVKGSEQARHFVDRYRALPNASDGWPAIIAAELALNGNADAEGVGQARAAIDGVIAKDSAFLRAYVLGARLSINQKRFDSAISSLEAAVALNPAHDIARKLLQWSQEAERAENREP